MSAPSPARIAVTPDHLAIDGRPVFLFGGDCNYTRTPRRHWRDRLLKMKAAGMNTVTFYLVWACHEPQPGHWDWAGDRDVAAFLDMIHLEGLYAIARLGPFIHGEWRNGGLPQWLVDRIGAQRCRSNDPEYLRHTSEWYRRELAVVAPRLITRGGPVVMLQMENELGSAGSKGDDIPRGSADAEENRRHVLHYYKLVCDAGVNVPIIDISHWPGREEAIANLVDTGGGYPAACFGSEGEIWPIDKERWGRHQRPCVTIETGSSMFVRFYDLPPYRNTRGYQGPIVQPAMIEALSLGHLAEGAGGVNYYMVTDGQQADGNGERMLPARDVNFQSPITGVGALRESYRWLKRLGWMLRSFEQEVLGAKPNYTWARAVSYGKAHPGVEQTGDLFEGYHAEARAPQGLDLVRHVAEVESAGRCTPGLNLSESNFLILRNTKIHGAAWRRDIRIETSSRGIPCETSREYPRHIQLDLPPQRNKILPFYVKLQPRTFLEYSTAELLDRRAFGPGADQLILHADADEVFETAVVTERQCPIRTRGECLPLWETPCTVTLIGRPGVTPQVSVLSGERPLRIVHLGRELAGQVWDLDSPDGPVVAISNLTLLDGGKLAQSDGSAFFLWILAPRAPRIAGLAGRYDAEFGVYEAGGALPHPARAVAWRHRRDGGRAIWEADVTPALLEDVRDVVLRARYEGACARAYLDEMLIGDHYFGRHLIWEVGLRDWLTAPAILRLEFEDTLQVDVQIVCLVERPLDIRWP